MNMPTTKGFTLTETIIALGVFAVIAFAVSSAGTNFSSSGKMRSAAEGLLSAARLSQENSKAGISDSPHGFYIRTNGGSLSAVSYEGPSYSLRNSGKDREFDIGTGFIISGTDIAPDTDGGYDINFSQGEGMPDKTGYFILSDVRSGLQRTINIAGLLEVETIEPGL